MSLGAFSKYDVSIASGASTSTAIDLGRGYSKVVYDCTSSGGASTFFAASSFDGTYRQIKFPVASGLVAPGAVTVGSACSGSLVEVSELKGHRFLKVAATGTIANGATLALYACDI